MKLSELELSRQSEGESVWGSEALDGHTISCVLVEAWVGAGSTRICIFAVALHLDVVLSDMLRVTLRVVRGSTEVISYL